MRTRMCRTLMLDVGFSFVSLLLELSALVSAALPLPLSDFLLPAIAVVGGGEVDMVTGLRVRGGVGGEMVGLAVDILYVPTLV